MALETDHLLVAPQQRLHCETNISSKLSQAIKDDTISKRAGVQAIQHGQDRIQKGLDHQRHRLIADWISTTDFPLQQSDFIARREDGTGQWFLGGDRSTIFPKRNLVAVLDLPIYTTTTDARDRT